MAILLKHTRGCSYPFADVHAKGLKDPAFPGFFDLSDERPLIGASLNSDSPVIVPLFPHGGARRRPGERSDTLDAQQCRALIDSAARAAQSGRSFNRFITILWERGALADADATAATRSFIKLASDWFRQHGERLCWAYVHEWGKQNGAHVHILLHVPKSLDRKFRGKPLRWTKAILPINYKKGILDTTQVIGGNAPDDVSWDLYGHSIEARIHYMLKAAPPYLEKEVGVLGWGRANWGQTSRIFGKRLGVWQDRGTDTGS